MRIVIKMAQTPHSGLTGTECHEPKGADTASANEVYIADGAGSGSFQTAPWLTALTATTDNTVPRFNGTSGQLQTSGIVVDDSDNVTGIVSLAASTITEAGTSLAAKYVQIAPEVSKDADYSTPGFNNATLMDDDDLINISLAASTNYYFHGQIVWDATDSATGIKLAFNLASGTLTESRIHLLDIQPDSSGITIQEGAMTDTFTVAHGSPGGTGNNMLTVNGYVSVNNAAELDLRWSQDVATTAGTVTFHEGSYIEFHRKI